MRYLVRQKIFSFGDSFTITDENGIDRYKIQGKVFSLGNKLTIYDLACNKLIYIEQKIFKFLPQYEIYEGDTLVARVKKQLTFFKPRFEIESGFGNFQVEGDVWGYNFSVIKNGLIVARVEKKFMSFSDTYSVDVFEGERDEFILALVIVIDQVLHDNNHNNS